MFFSTYWVAGKEVELELGDLTSRPNIFPNQLYDIRQVTQVCGLTITLTMGNLFHVSVL